MQQSELHMEQQCTLIETKIVGLIGQEAWDNFKLGASAMFALETLASLSDEDDRQKSISSVVNDRTALLLPEIQSLTVGEYLQRASYYKDLQDRANVAILGDQEVKVLGLWRELSDLRSHLAFAKLRRQAEVRRDAETRR